MSFDLAQAPDSDSVAARTPEPQSVGLVHDYLLVMRGAERTFAEMASCWPGSPLYTLLYDASAMNGHFANRQVHTSVLQRLGPRQRNFRRLAPAFPRAIQKLPVSGHDLVISSSSAFAHGVQVGAGAQHVCYCHSPLRYAWHETARATAAAPRLARPIVRRGLQRVRGWDHRAAQRVDHYIANSELTRERIQRYYGRDAYEVIHPPVDVARFSIGEPAGYFLVVGELVSHKQVELALEAARVAGQQIKVVGSGPDRQRLELLYGDTAQFLGRVSDKDLEGLYSHALALVMPNVEEFGIAAVESQAAGRPVVAADAGGARETVVDGETGVLVPPGDVVALTEVMSEVDFSRFRSPRIQRHAAQFSSEAFRHRLVRAVAHATGLGSASAITLPGPQPDHARPDSAADPAEPETAIPA